MPRAASAEPRPAAHATASPRRMVFRLRRERCAARCGRRQAVRERPARATAVLPRAGPQERRFTFNVWFNIVQQPNLIFLFK